VRERGDTIELSRRVELGDEKGDEKAGMLIRSRGIEECAGNGVDELVKGRAARRP
jgi:hypothetical protein